MLAAQKADEVTQKTKEEVSEMQSQDLMDDPVIQLQLEELALRWAEYERQKNEGLMKHEREMEKMYLDSYTKLQSDEESNATKLVTTKLQTEQQRDSARIQARAAATRAKSTNGGGGNA
jgi:hypothetical protein